MLPATDVPGHLVRRYSDSERLEAVIPPLWPLSLLQLVLVRVFMHFLPILSPCCVAESDQEPIWNSVTRKRDNNCVL